MSKLEFNDVIKFAKMEYEKYIKPLEDHGELNPDHGFEKILFLLKRLINEKAKEGERDISLTPLLIALTSLCGVALKNINPDIIYEFSKVHFAIPTPMVYDDVIGDSPTKPNDCSECGRVPLIYKMSDSLNKAYAVRCHSCRVTTILRESIADAVKIWNNKQVWVEADI
ncbi:MULTISPECIES: hypothetical protein [Leptospira]|uniref:hypothetical protein n=1 Tax=Leptospira TaxID=171 RepID=UPI001F10A08A|nr:MULTISPECIES: hypothetical protein [Leptospira]UML79127.1 hypothetical protein FH602_12330 [Leptospira kirschneri]UML80382.1 hypothetical protein FH602_19390 [Leptospira kirschneri]UMQ54076.1 hypothetical protein FH582_19535 [Leptospira interrogans]